MAQDKFRVGITRDTMKSDGTPIFDASCLKILDDPRIEWEWLPEIEAELTPETRVAIRRAGGHAGQGHAQEPSRGRTDASS